MTQKSVLLGLVQAILKCQIPQVRPRRQTVKKLRVTRWGIREIRKALYLAPGGLFLLLDQWESRDARHRWGQVQWELVILYLLLYDTIRNSLPKILQLIIGNTILR